MNKIIYCLFICISFMLSSCAQQNDFKYKGELPKEKYQITELSADNIQYLDGDSIAIRNRIYIDLDVDGNLYLNNHLVTIEDFSRNY